MLLKNELTKLESHIKNAHHVDIKVSTKPIAWHIDHSLKVIISVCDVLLKSDPALYVWKFNGIRAFVFLFRYFPRGKGKAPKMVLPPENIIIDDLYSQLELAKKKLNNTLKLPAKSNFKHPYFGVLNLLQTQRFLKMHTRHHLKICEDIIN